MIPTTNALEKYLRKKLVLKNCQTKVNAIIKTKTVLPFRYPTTKTHRFAPEPGFGKLASGHSGPSNPAGSGTAKRRLVTPKNTRYDF